LRQAVQAVVVVVMVLEDYQHRDIQTVEHTLAVLAQTNLVTVVAQVVAVVAFTVAQVDR
jgi:hypothetical protein